MRVLHVCLSNFYIDGSGYQENFLVQQHVRDGHDVLVIASTETFDGHGGLTYVPPSSYAGGDGAEVIRLPYVSWLPQKIARKLRIHPHVYQSIADFSPDTILFHGCAGNELVTVARYAKDHPGVLFYADSHADYNNSARSFVSRKLLHGLFYRNRLTRALPWIRKILCVSTEAIEFLNELYGVPRERMEFFPLGGSMMSNDELKQRRNKTRLAYGLSPDNFVFIQSGKFTLRKKLAKSLRAFAAIRDETLRFLIVGILTDAVKAEINALIAADARVSFLGWKTTSELTDLLCAADAYVQPGTQSATMQHALCCGCPVIIDDVTAHQVYRPSGATLLNASTSLSVAFAAAIARGCGAGRRDALKFAQQTLDYQILASRILH